MLADFESKTLNRWIASPASQNSENMASRSHETKRVPDPYIQLVKDGKILTASEQQPVENYILQRDLLEKLEYQAFLKIQDWANKNDEGLMLWFSPPSIGGYGSLKIVVSEILFLNKQKILFNRAVLIDNFDGLQSVGLANYLSEEKFVDTEDLRYSPIPLEKSRRQELLDLLSIYVPEQVQLIRSSADIDLKDKTLAKTQTIRFANPHIAEQQARKMDLIGDKKDSCEREHASGFNIMYEGTATIDGYFECPKCHGKIKSGLGIENCPHCGLTKAEAGSLCV